MTVEVGGARRGLWGSAGAMQRREHGQTAHKVKECKEDCGQHNIVLSHQPAPAKRLQSRHLLLLPPPLLSEHRPKGANSDARCVSR